MSVGAPAPSGIYSHAVVAAPFVFISGQAPLDARTGEVVGETFEEQLRQTLANLTAIAAEVDGTLADVVRFGVYLSDLTDRQALNAVFEELFTPPFPARTTIHSDLVRFLVEIDAVLYLPHRSASEIALPAGDGTSSVNPRGFRPGVSRQQP